MEELRMVILQKMATKLDKEQLDMLATTLDVVLYDYTIEKKSTELTVIDKSNDILLKNFLGSKAIEGCSKRTIKHYGETIQRMLDDVGKNIWDITTDDIRHHLALWQVTRGVSNATLDNMRKAYSSFFKWLSIERYITDNPMLRINPFKHQKRQVKPFTEREMEQICSACDTYRDRALVEFLYSTGCRVSECSAIVLSDIDFKQGTVRIQHGKGDKERICYISDKCMYWLEKYLMTRTDTDVSLWHGKRGQLTKNGIEMIIRNLGRKAGVYAHPHKFRHTLASDMAKRNAPVQIIQQILGHEDINTTMIYVSVDNKDVENAYRKLVA